MSKYIFFSWQGCFPSHFWYPKLLSVSLDIDSFNLQYVSQVTVQSGWGEGDVPPQYDTAKFLRI